MLKKILNKFIVFALFAAHSFSAPLLEDIKGLDLTNPGYEDLNPLHGYVWNQGILENHGEMLDKDNKLRELIQLLFHRTGTFDPSTQPETNSAVPHLTPEIIGTILGELKNQEISSLKDLSGKLKGGEYNNARTSLNKLQRLLNALRTDPRAYKVMLSLLWYKANDKEDFKAYYEGVRSKNNAAVKEIPANWSEQKFSLADAKSPIPDFKTNYDAYLYWVAKQSADVPPLEHQAYSYVPQGFADCGETSLKNFIKLAIDRDGSYDVSVLKTLGAKPEVLKFFEDFPNRRKQVDQKARDAWAKVTMNLSGVQYGFKTYEICPRTNASANMLAVLGALFDELKGITEWEEVAQKIQEARKNNRLGRFIIEETKLSNGYGTVTFAVEKFGSFDWHFETIHYYILPKPGKSFGDYPLKDIIDDIGIFYQLDQLPKANTVWHLYARLRQNEVIESAVEKLKTDNKLTTTIKVALLNRLSTDDARSRVFPKVISSTADITSLMADKQFKPSMAYLGGLANAGNFASAKELVKHRFFLQDIKTYFIGHTDYLSRAVFSHDGKKVLTASKDKTARIWDADTGAMIKELTGHTSDVLSAVFSADGTKVLTASFDKTARIWDADTGAMIRELTGHNGWVSSVVFSADGKKVLTASFDKTARIWDADTGAMIKELTGHTQILYSAVFSADGKKVLTASEDKIARIWDADTGAMIKEFKGHTDNVSSAVFSADGKKVLTASFDKTARIWDADTGAMIRELTGHTQIVYSAVFSADDKKVLTASEDKIARIWDADTGDMIKEFKGHTDYVSSAVFSADGTKVLTASGDKTARIWDVSKPTN